MEFQLSKKVKRLPPYLFLEIDKAKRKALAEGKDVIDLGIGDPDEATPVEIVDALYKASGDPKNQHYPMDAGISEFREKAGSWYKERFNVELDPSSEILALIGSKEGIAHMPLSFVDEGDIVLVPDPGYPPYERGTILAGGEPYKMPLLEKNNFLPDLDSIEKNILKKAKILHINYPNNPTAAVCERAFFKKVVEFAKRHNIIVAHDAAYSEIYYDNFRPVSFLETDGAKEVGVEFHSLSKTCNMTGWRIGFVCGNEKIVSANAKVKSNIDSGAFNAIQIAAIKALDISWQHTERMNGIYKERRDALVDGLNEIGWITKKPKATFYVWTRIPRPDISSIDFAALVLRETGIVITPGVGMGSNGEGYVRMALTVNKERIKEAVHRLKKIL